jgi:hypothetical protein
MYILFDSYSSSKPTSAVNNWQATFSVTVKFHFSSTIPVVFFFFQTLPFSNLYYRAKEVLAMFLIPVNFDQIISNRIL